MDNIWEDYLAALPFVNLANIDRSAPQASRILRDGLAGQNLTMGRIPGAKNIPIGFQLKATLEGHRGTIQHFAWSPDGRYLASPEQEGTIGLWDTEQNQRLRELTDPDESIVTYTCVSWSPSSPQQELLAAGDTSGLVRIWNVRTGEMLQKLSHPTHNLGNIPEYSGGVRCVAWSPSDGKTLAVALSKEILLWSWNSRTGRARHLRSLDKHTGTVTSLVWSPDGTKLASASNDRSIFLWDTATWKSFHHFQGHQGATNSLAWLVPQEIIASSSDDGTIQLWNFITGEPAHSPIEGHRAAVTSIAFFAFHDDWFLASKSHDGTVRLWYHDNWLQVAMLSEASSSEFLSNLAFNPSKPLLATLSKKNMAIRIWELDFDTLTRAVPVRSTAYYCSAKVVLVGEGGTGKTSLWLRLQGQPFQEKMSTDALQVGRIRLGNVPISEENTETREIFLWDLAGQSHARIIHQLYLNDVAVALVVFNAAIDDPFAPIYYWVWALKQAQLVRKRKGSPILPIRMFLVAGRIDTCPISASVSERIEKLQQDLEFDYYFLTSAKDDLNIHKLDTAIRDAIDWSAFRMAIDEKLLGAGTPIDLTRQIQRLLAEKEKEPQSKLFSTIKELHKDFQRTYDCITDELEFRTCMNWMEMQGLIKNYTFSDYLNSDDYLLFKHDILGIYANALMNALSAIGKQGYVAEKKVRKGDFSIPPDQRIQKKEDERLLLLAMGQELLRQEFAFRQDIDGTWYLVFPSLCHEDGEVDSLHPKGQKVSFEFKGAPMHIYAMLIVRLKRSGRFYLDKLRENKVTYTARSVQDTTYGVILQDRGKGEGTLTLFFQRADGEAQTNDPDDTALEFEGFIEDYLQTRALPESVHRRDIFACEGSTCREAGKPISNETVERRHKYGHYSIPCDDCGKDIPLVRKRKALTDLDAINDMIDVAEAESINEAKDFSEAARHDIIEGHYLVYCSYLDKDEQKVRGISEALKSMGNTEEFTIMPFLRRDLIPGSFTFKALEKKIEQAQVALMFVGNDGQSCLNGQKPDDRTEMEKNALYEMEKFAFLAKPEYAAIPVILPGTSEDFRLSGFLSQRNLVDFRKSDPDPLDELVRGITQRQHMA